MYNEDLNFFLSMVHFVSRSIALKKSSTQWLIYELTKLKLLQIRKSKQALVDLINTCLSCFLKELFNFHGLKSNLSIQSRLHIRLFNCFLFGHSAFKTKHLSGLTYIKTPMKVQLNRKIRL